jgi:inosine/xanthosine triphosphatase
VGQVIDVVVGSTNPTKVGASQRVFARLGLARVIGMDVPSGVSPQPIGMAETAAGARTRADQALRARAADGARFGVGLEGGVELLPDGRGYLIGVAVIVREDGVRWEAVGPRLWLPPAAVDAVRHGEELGPVIDRLSGLEEAKTGIGAIGWLTGGLVDREQSWVVTLACAAAPLFHPYLYPGT